MDEIMALPAAPARATYQLVRAELSRVAHVDDMDVRTVLNACHFAWENYFMYVNTADLTEDDEGTWCHFLWQELSNKSIFENLLLATLVYSRKDSASKASLGQGVLDLCVQAIVKYPHDPAIVDLASKVIYEITPVSAVPPVL